MSSWKQKALERRKQQAESIPIAWRLKGIPQNFVDANPVIEGSGILTPREIKITNTTNGRVLAKKIQTREYSSREITTAYCKRAALAQQLTGCCTEMMFEAAIQRAGELDEYFARTGQLVGPLHGLPISLKDSHDIENIDTTLGWVGLIGKPATSDNVAVQQYRALGAVIYCKTNIPQSLMMSDSYNHVFGQSVNAFNKNLISGGSSGGEGAIIGAKASWLGIGTDIGGSIRIPATLQGLYGMSPTIGRIPNRESGRPQKHVVPPVAGPLASHIDSIEFFMQEYLRSEPWKSDPQMLPVPWSPENLTTPLKIGYIVDDGVVLPQPPIQRAVRELVQKLKEAGNELVEWDSTSHKSAYFDLWLPAVLADGGKRCADLCDLIGEPLIEGMLVGRQDDTLSATQRQDLAEKIWDYQHAYLKRWQESGIYALIMPVTPYVGLKPKDWVKSQQYCGYTAHWNLLNYTALAIPMTKADRDVDQADSNWKGHEGRSFADQFNHEQYDPDLVDGMPVGLQIVTGRFGEEKAIALARIVKSLQQTDAGAPSNNWRP